MAGPEVKKMALKITAPVKTGRVAKTKRMYRIKINIGKQAATNLHNRGSPLLSLPGEIRNQIYHYVIGGYEACPTWDSGACIDVELRASRYNTSGGTRKCWAELFNLTYVCKQLNMETKNLPYELTVFQADIAAAFERFMCQLKEEKKQLITTVSFGFKHFHSVSYWTDAQFPTPAELFRCTSLKTMISRITLGQGQKLLVKLIARHMGARIIPENEHLGYIEDQDVCEEEQDVFAEDEE
ncbi:uncharacterized protein J4E84_009008 [Alternaria hordeiaustralica]|uniref:uncharacterized protein n=1 Tax=Alternaria hordeiaustralica TaxID=1187925 RepID=UPI0020C53A56|nr:uncharacterized protein J4E84_009008 [Alternaria hordeiaustralica]KAI4677689.1 hypothetical protein J4E84_009008 [Alternaria hordeiaustralica]